MTTKDGRAAPAFVQFWDRICRQIEGQENNQNTLIADLEAIVAGLQASTEAAQQAQTAANNAQATADAAGGGTSTSGTATNPSIDLLDASWVLGPQVDLTGVVAGPLTITGSGPQQDGDVELTGGNGGMTCQFRIVEIVGGVDDVRFIGSFVAVNYGGGTATISNQSVSDVSTFTEARTSTGAVSYRIDAKGTGSRVLTDLLLYIYARRG